MTTKLRPPVKWHGGKHYMVHRILGLLPEHATYVEPFGGAASVLLNKDPSPVEVYNDLDGRITRLFRVLRDHGEELRHLLQLTPYDELEWMECETSSLDDVEAARRDFVRWRQSIGGRGDSFSVSLHRVRRGMSDNVSGYLSAIDEQLPLITARLRRVEILCRPAVTVIQQFDAPQTCVYCDPPYVTSSVSTPCAYEYEMTDEEHRQLATVLKGCKSKVLLSGYQCQLYDELYGDWRKVEFDMPNNSAIGKEKKRRIETVWMNW